MFNYCVIIGDRRVTYSCVYVGNIVYLSNESKCYKVYLLNKLLSLLLLTRTREMREGNDKYIPLPLIHRFILQIRDSTRYKRVCTSVRIVKYQFTFNFARSMSESVARVIDVHEHSGNLVENRM